MQGIQFKKTYMRCENEEDIRKIVNPYSSFKCNSLEHIQFQWAKELTGKVIEHAVVFRQIRYTFLLFQNVNSLSIIVLSHEWLKIKQNKVR